MSVITTTRPAEVWKKRRDAPFYDLGDANAVAIAHTFLHEAQEKKESVRIVTGDKEEGLFMEILPELSATATATDVKVIYVGEESPALKKMVEKELSGTNAQFTVIQPTTDKPTPYYWLIGDDALRLKRDPDGAVAVSFLDNDVIGRELAQDFTEREKQAKEAKVEA